MHKSYPPEVRNKVIHDIESYIDIVSQSQSIPQELVSATALGTMIKRIISALGPDQARVTLEQFMIEAGLYSTQGKEIQ